MRSLIIAVDFDGTVVEDAYPRIGKPQLFAFETLKALKQEKHRLILWTCRKGDRLQEAVEFCRENGMEFYAVNSNFPDEPLTSEDSPKIVADLYIDDRNLGGFPGWDQVWKALKPNDEMPEAEMRSKGIFQRLFG
ncbi:BT0820 family HAD-type phosphatase [Tunicatimonas pelagia]|uniref:BT0820 family HAD-type phosphatase n=1 Tax=Tunicatimonas pelagia TaxID=931531 RepID=UPI002666ED68|nr:hydrolase [Tunicatimonas pelagia]WKN45912.1 hydrolase [Tunicatimonas pelagia]